MMDNKDSFNQFQKVNHLHYIFIIRTIRKITQPNLTEFNHPLKNINQQSSKSHQKQQKEDQTKLNYEEFDLNTFKTKECSNQDDHNRKHCPYYHNDNDRRRNPKEFTYHCDFCQYGKTCQTGDSCKLSHNKVEQLYHPNRYKTKYCESKGQCEYGQYCSFAHNDDEIVIPLILHQLPQDAHFWMYCYKTVWCPYIDNHDRGSCVYAHNAQDFRRDPQLFYYDPIDCQQWSKSQKVKTYEQGDCPQMENCKYCHGWKEQEYHPNNYKTKRCSNGVNCKKKNRECAYYHQDNFSKVSDRRFKQENNSQKQTKNSSNFQGPIKPLIKRKLLVGQPFEIFSNFSGFDTTDSRKMSDISQETPCQNKYEKKNRSAPSTPPENANYNQIEKIEGINISIPIPIYSDKFIKKLQKTNSKEANEILNQLKSNYISEKNLMKMSRQELQSLGIFKLDQIIIILQVVEIIDVDQKDEDFIRSIMEPNQF